MTAIKKQPRPQRPRKGESDAVSCLLIQWEREQPPVDADGNLVCPECGQSAELILGVFGQPCYTHAVRPARKAKVQK